MSRENKTFESIEFKFENPYTHEEERFDYYLTDEDMVEAIKLYADFYDVRLDGTDTHIWNLFVTLDAGRYDFVNEIWEKILDNDFVKEHISEKVIEKAKEEYLEEVEDNRELD